MQGHRRSDLDRSCRNSAAHGAFTLAALLAVFLQAFIVQTHVHALGPISLAAVERSASGDDSHQHASLPHTQAGCVICQALAANGAAALPSAATLDEPQAYAEAPIALRQHVAPLTRTHAWQSRAPPTFL